MIDRRTMVRVVSSWRVRLVALAFVICVMLSVCPTASGSSLDSHHDDGAFFDLENQSPNIGYAELLHAVASLDEDVEWIQPILLDQTSETTPKSKPKGKPAAATGTKATLPTKQPASPTATAPDPADDIEVFSKKFRRSYIDAATKEKRKQILTANMKLAQAKNAKPHTTHASRSKAGGSLQPSHVKTKHDGAGPARFGVTRFSDLTPEEFKRVFNTAKIDYSKIKKTKAAPKSTKTTAAKETTRASEAKATTAAKARFAAVESEAEGGQPPPPPPPKPAPGAGRILEAGSGSFTATFHTNDHNHLQRFYTNDEIAAIRAQAKVVPTVSYTKLNDFVDQPVDWSGLSPVIRDIGACGACWAATAADLLQTSLFRATGKPSLQFSFQYLTDCDHSAMGSSGTLTSQPFRQSSYGANVAASNGANAGCMGGSVQNSVRFMRSQSSPTYAPGLNYFEKDYGALLPPMGWMTMRPLPIPPCRDSNQGLRQPVIDDFSYAVFPTAYQAFSIQDVMFAKVNSDYEYPGHPSKALGAPGSPTATVDREVLLAQALNKWGPLCVTIDASQLMNYKSGIIDSSMCSSDPTIGQHQALLVGLASSGAQQYWVVKNSWGEAWGVNGYMYIARGSNTCGITSSVIRFNVPGDASDPVVKEIEALWAMYTAKGVNT